MPDCDAINNLFIAMEGHIAPIMARKGAPTMRPWQTATPRATWENGMGRIHNSLVFERSVVTDNGDEWTDTVASDGASNDACLLVPEIIKFGQTNRTMQVQKRNIQTQEICVEDLRDDFQIAQVLEGVASTLNWNRDYVWESRDRREYIRLSEHKITEDASFDIDGTSFDFVGNPPTSKLLLGTLRQIHQRLLMEGAQSDGAVGNSASGMPVFDLFTDPNTARDLIMQDPLIREDFRFAFQGSGMNSPLLQQLGTSVSYDGFRPVFDAFPERYDLSGNRVQPYILPPVAATKGFKQNVNPAYTYAPYQISVVHLPTVFTQRVPGPITSPGGGLKFDPVNYLGDFKWLNIAEKECNPRGTKGFFDAVFASASEPGNTWLGFAIAHLNCPALRSLKPSCYS